MADISETQLANWAFSVHDERQYEFMQHKFSDRRKLSDEAEAARKLADRSETVDGKPNPHYPRLRMEAEMAQMRMEMAYIIDKNRSLSAQVEVLAYLSERVSILEGAYSHVKMIAETCRNYSHHLYSMLKNKDSKPKEYTNEQKV